MKGLKKTILIVFTAITLNSNAQYGFGAKVGFQQSVPLVLRDSFGGKPAIGCGISLYFPPKKSVNMVLGMSYRAMSVSHKIEPYNLVWNTLALNFGTEWTNVKFDKTKFYTGLNAAFIYEQGKVVISGSNSSGTGYVSSGEKNKLVPSFELGLVFNPNKNLHVHIGTIQPFEQGTRNQKPEFPGALSFGLEYRIHSKDFEKWEKDTSQNPERVFTQNLKEGILYFVLEGTDSSARLLEKILNENYKYSRFGFIPLAAFKDSLEMFKNHPNSASIFIAKMGGIIYDVNRAPTQGLIVYDHKMENPLPDNALFVRNVSNDVFFEDPLLVSKMIKTLNTRLFKMYRENKK